MAATPESEEDGDDEAGGDAGESSPGSEPERDA